MTHSINHIRIITGSGEVLEDGALAYENGIIMAVGEGEIPADDMRDGRGKTMIPGLFDGHVHLGMEVPGTPGSEKTEDPAILGARIMKQCLEFPKFGITSVRNMATDQDADVYIRNLIEENDLQAARIYASGTAISITGGHGNLEDGFDSEAEILRETRRKIKIGADVVKFVMTGGMGTKGSVPTVLQYHAEEIRSSIEEAKRCGKITGAHCTSLQGAREAIKAGMRSIEHAQLDEETAALMEERNRSGDEVFYCPTIAARYSIIHNTDPAYAWLTKKAKPGDLERKFKAVRLCLQHGIRVCAGTDTNSPFVYVGDLLKELELYVEAGMTPMQAIQSATVNAAALCMAEKQTGSLEAGKQADFVILSANPLEDIRNLRQVEETRRKGMLLYRREEEEKAGRTLIRNVRLIDGLGEVREGQNLLYDESGILAIGTEDYPADKVIDGSGKTVMPGLIDCHVHLGSGVLGSSVSREEQAAAILLQGKVLFEHGITSVRTMSTADWCDVKVRDLVDSGYLPGPRIIACGKGISITGGHGWMHNFEVDTLEETRKAARQIMRSGADFIKLFATGGMGTKGSIPNAPQLSEEQMRVICEEAARTGITTAAHCTGIEGAQRAIRAGVRSIEHIPMDEETAVMMKEHGCYYVPTIVTRYHIIHSTEPQYEHMRKKASPQDLEKKKRAIGLCLKYGIPVAAGTDAIGSIKNNGLTRMGESLLTELHIYREYGMTDMQAIQAATQTAAKLLRIDQETGTLEVGKKADLILLSGNPARDIDDLKTLLMTVHNGRIVYHV